MNYKETCLPSVWLAIFRKIEIQFHNSRKLNKPQPESPIASQMVKSKDNNIYMLNINTWHKFSITNWIDKFKGEKIYISTRYVA